MTTQTQSLGSFQDDAAEVTFSYDDVTLLLLSVTIRNDGLPFALTVTLSDPADHEVFFTRTRRFGEGEVTQNLSNFNVHVIEMTARGGVRLPFDVALGGS